MKKSLLALLAVLCLCVGSAKAMYIIGEPAGGWDPTKGLEMNQTQTGVWSITIQAKQGNYFAFAGTLGSSNDDAGWATLNATRYGAKVKDQSVVDGTYDVEYQKDQSWQFGKEGEAKLTLDTNAKTLTVKYLTEVDVEIGYVLHGTFTSTEWKDVTLTESNGKWGIKNFQVSQTNAEFGIKKINADTGDQLDWIASATYAPASYISGGNGSNYKIQPGTYDITYDPEANTLTITKAEIWSAVVKGTSHLMAINANGFPYYDTSELGSNDDLARKNLTWYFSSSEGRELTYSGSITENGTYKLTEGSTPFTVPNAPNAAYTITLDAEHMQMVVTGLNMNIDTDWYLSYNSAGAGGWQFDHPMSVQEGGETYSCVVTLPAGDNNNKNWITISNGKMNGNWSGTDYTRYGASGSGDYAITGNTSNLQLVKNSSNCWTLQAGGTWTVTINPSAATIKFTKGDVAVVSRRPSNVWLIGSFQATETEPGWRIPTESGGAIEANGAIMLNQDATDENVFTGTYLWRDEAVDFTLVGTYGATDAANWYGPAKDGGVDEVVFTEENGTYSYDGYAAVFTAADGAVSSRYWDINDTEHMNANTVVTVKFTYKFNETSKKDESSVEFSYDPTPVIDDMDGMFVIFSNDGWATTKEEKMKMNDQTRVWTATIDEQYVISGTQLRVAFKELIDEEGNAIYYMPAEIDGTYPSGANFYKAILNGKEMDMGKTALDGVIGTTMLTVYSSKDNPYTNVESYWTYTPDDSVTVFVALNRNQLLAAFSKEEIMTGVEEVEAAGEGEVVWFNLQGVRVANPTNGLYIRVQNGKASKVVL